VVRKAVDAEVQVEHVRRKFEVNMKKMAPQISLRHLFDHVDWLNRGFVNKSDLKRLIDQYSEHVSEVTV